MVAKSVNALLEDVRLLGDEQLSTVEAVRELVKARLPSVTEEVKYGGILFASGVPFCGVFAYKDHVSVEFSRGSSIPDTPGHLEGGGKFRRHIKLRSLKDVQAKQLVYYFQPALQAMNNDA